MIIRRESVLCHLRLVPILENVGICFTAVSALTPWGWGGDKLSYVLWESLSENKCSVVVFLIECFVFCFCLQALNCLEKP